ncbi:hypothetical protein AB0C12_16355 [Actinoplanes sp. NPDC048967]|uniref:hypothetical protein n=1 Tax=Actinoplanes sp. NPDC048967 TaxID=3155269 RepID=UPI0033C938A5
MTTQVPPGPENAVAPQDYPQFTTGYAAYPPPQSAGGGYPAVSYPQEGAAGYPEPVPYPQPGGPPQAAAHPPPSAYPTAPPWATAGQAPTPPEQPLPQYGGLLVPFPDEMRHASRAQAPAVWPVAVFTMLFGIFGAISAKRRADQARRTRNSTAPYWITFLISLVAGAFCSFVASAVLVGPLVTELRENQRLEAVQRNVVGDGQLKAARINVTAARCRAVGERDVEGMREYLCRLTLDDGHTASLTLTADEDGQWQSGPGR